MGLRSPGRRHRRRCAREVSGVQSTRDARRCRAPWDERTRPAAPSGRGNRENSRHHHHRARQRRTRRPGDRGRRLLVHREAAEASRPPRAPRSRLRAPEGPSGGCRPHPPTARRRQTRGAGWFVKPDAGSHETGRNGSALNGIHPHHGRNGIGKGNGGSFDCTCCRRAPIDPLSQSTVRRFRNR